MCAAWTWTTFFAVDQNVKRDVLIDVDAVRACGQCLGLPTDEAHKEKRVCLIWMVCLSGLCFVCGLCALCLPVAGTVLESVVSVIVHVVHSCRPLAAVCARSLAPLHPTTTTSDGRVVKRKILLKERM